MAEQRKSFARFPAGPDDVGRRLDRVARKFLAGHPLGTVFGAIRRGEVRVNGEKAEGSYRLRSGDSVDVSAALSPAPPSVPQARPLPAWFREAIVLENENILALDKPAGLLTHGHSSLESFVGVYLASITAGSLSFVPGPLHRLDRNTSGLVLFGKSVAGASRFAALLRSHSVTKRYLALLEGRLEQAETWSDRLSRDTSARRTHSGDAGREVRCIVSPLCAGPATTLVSVAMQSGFTHQIRAQAAAHSHPLSGDAKYGAPPTGHGFILHAGAIALSYFDTVLGFRSLEASVPEQSRLRLESIFGARRVASALEEGGFA